MSLDERGRTGDASPFHQFEEESYSQDDMFVAPTFQEKWFVFKSLIF